MISSIGPDIERRKLKLCNVLGVNAIKKEENDMKTRNRIFLVVVVIALMFSMVGVNRAFAVSTPSISVSVSGGQAVFTWNNTGADCYAIYISKKNSSGKYVLIYDGDNSPVYGNTFSYSLDEGEYRANMRAWSGGKPSGFSNLAYFTITQQSQGTAIAPSINSQINGNTVRLYWQDTGADCYAIYIAKRDSAGNYVLIYDGDNTPVYGTESVHTLEAGRYCVNARAWKSGNPSAFSERIYFDVTGQTITGDWKAVLKDLYDKEGIYWNYYGKPYSTVEQITSANYSYTYTPCNCNDHTHSIPPYDPTCTCNKYGVNQWSQCMGFAALNYNRIWGVDPDFYSEKVLTNISVLEPGDIVKFRYTPNMEEAYPYHYVLILEVDVASNTVTVLDCNYGANCIIRYGATFTYDYMYRYGETPTYIEGK